MFTSKMVSEFKGQCAKQGVDYDWFQEIDEVSPEAIGLKVAESIQSSYTASTKTRSMGESAEREERRRRGMSDREAYNPKQWKKKT